MVSGTIFAHHQNCRAGTKTESHRSPTGTALTANPAWQRKSALPRTLSAVFDHDGTRGLSFPGSTGDPHPFPTHSSDVVRLSVLLQIFGQPEHVLLRHLRENFPAPAVDHANHQTMSFRIFLET